MEAETGGLQPQARECTGPPEAGRAEEASLANILIEALYSLTCVRLSAGIWPPKL